MTARPALVFSARTDRWRLELLTRQSTPGEDFSILRSALYDGGDALQARWTCDVQTTWSFSDSSECPASNESAHAPAVFENRQYLLRVRAAEGVALKDVSHPWSREVDGGLDIDDKSCHATLRTGNDIGRFPLEITTEVDGQMRTDRITWQVWPLKLDYGKDLEALTKAVEKEYPLWLYRFLAPTDHEAGRSDAKQDRFLLLWLKQFEALRERFEHGVRTVIRSPHQRLDEHVRHLRADRIRGKMSPRLEEKVASGRDRPETRCRVETRRSSFDTAENRFVKHAVGQVAARLDQVQSAIDAMLAKNQEGQGGVSDNFRSRLGEWRRSVRSQAASPLFRTVGDFEGLSQESLVLHNRAGYSAVYRTWLELRHYLEFFAKVRSTNIGMRQISELYELWCFLELRRILTSKELGFKEVSFLRQPQLRRKNELETSLENGFGAAFLLRHERAGIAVRLAHEPVFGRQGADKIHSYTVSQKPDIVLEATWSDGQRLLWIFDAKYRVKSFRDDQDDERSESQPLVPPDALDQMHRYRDALILRETKGDEKSRPVIGAYALYPGVFEQSKHNKHKNPYDEAIREVGIGAFPLLPRPDHDVWLREHLRSALGIDMTDSDELIASATLLAQENVRIPVTGLEYVKDDLLLVPLFDRNGRLRSPTYYQGFRDGSATGYHTRVVGGPSVKQLRQIRYLAAIVPDSDRLGQRRIHGIFRISSSNEEQPRNELSVDLTGIESDPFDTTPHHVLYFEPDWIPLPRPLDVEGLPRGNWFRYTRADLLQRANTLSDLKLVRERSTNT